MSAYYACFDRNLTAIGCLSLSLTVPLRELRLDKSAVLSLPVPHCLSLSVKENDYESEKVAGSSPAERAPKSPANRRVLLFLEPLVVRAYHLSDHLRTAERAFQGPVRVEPVPLSLSAKRPIASS